MEIVLIANKGDLHFEKRRGTRSQARDYCTKHSGRVGGPYEVGDWAEDQQGRRSDLAAAHELFKEGGLKRVAFDAPLAFIKYHRGFAALEAFISQPKPRTEARTTRVLVGPSGIGKTKWANDTYGDDLYICPVQHGEHFWFDGYSGQSAVLIDDYRGKIRFEELLKITDPWYDQRVPVKNGFTIWKPKVVVITSNKLPAYWYPTMTGDELNPLNRRLTVHVLNSALDISLLGLPVDDYIDLE